MVKALMVFRALELDFRQVKINSCELIFTLIFKKSRFTFFFFSYGHVWLWCHQGREVAAIVYCDHYEGQWR